MPADSNLPFRRIYVDLPQDVAKRLEVRARESRRSMKAYLADLIQADYNSSGNTAASRSKVSK